MRWFAGIRDVEVAVLIGGDAVDIGDLGLGGHIAIALKAIGQVAGYGCNGSGAHFADSECAC